MPYFFRRAFGENGDITAIPVEDQGDGKVSYQNGWPEGYELDPNVDPDEAQNLSRTNFNGLFFNITSALQTLQTYGCNPYITPSDNGGTPFPYPLGGLCYYTAPDSGEFGVYRSLQSGNTEIPMVNGIMSPLWQREFDVLLDSIKSNRIYNVPLRYATLPTIVPTSESMTITVYAYSKFLFANGVYEDNSLNNSIVYFNNDKVLTLDAGSYAVNGQYIIFATSEENLLFMDYANYSELTSQSDVISELGHTSPNDIYYFDRDANKWKFRAANQSTFTTLTYSLCPIATFFLNNNELSELNIIRPLRILNEQEVAQELEKKQNSLVPGKHIDIQTIDNSSSFIRANLPAKTTPFCVNSCNINASTGDIDLLYSDTVVDIKENEPSITPFGNNGTISTPQYCYDAANAWGGQYETYFNTGGKAKATVEYAFTYNNPIEITSYGGNLTFSYYVPYGRCNAGYAHARRQFWVDLEFTDGTVERMYTSPEYADQGTEWENKKFDIPEYCYGKYLACVRFYVYLYCYCSYRSYTFLYLKNINVNVSRRDIVFNTSKIYFKTGSNYIEQLDTEGNAVLLTTNENCKITSSIEGLDVIWTNGIVSLKDWWTEFETSYEFLDTPAETNNAKLFIRYNDIDAEGILSNFNIVLTYWGGATYNLLTNYSFFKTNDLLIDVPNGKYIKKITISAKDISNLSGSSFGMVRLYNEVDSNITFTQYPAIYATNADGSNYMMLNNVPPITLYYPGYVMLSNNEAYILPGTNVIRKQKKKPTLADEPALRDGDVWLDLSSEPLCAYQYYNGNWVIFNDVPVGYVSADYLSPSATIDVEGTGITEATCDADTFKSKIAATGSYEFIYDGSNWQLDGQDVTLSEYGISITGTPDEGDTITVDFDLGDLIIESIDQYPINQNGYNINAFTENIASIPGRDGRDGQNGKDGKNGAPGAKGDPGVGIPTGGLRGQILAKASNVNYDTKWTTMASTALFDGGQAGQTLVKNSSDDLDFSWQTLEALPSGGNTGDVLIKDSSANYDVSWSPIHGVPAGGTSGQALVKLSDSDFNYAWQDTGGGDALLVGKKTNFKLNQYFYASANGYRNIVFEQFFDTTGINSTADDGAAVISTYWDNRTLMVNNTSAGSITFQLDEITFTSQIDHLLLAADFTGTVVFSFSTDSGTTWSSITPDVPIQLVTSNLILKIQLSSLATVSSIAIATR